MKLEQVKEIANAVLYEGYLLYPYRHSAIKNRQRWTIGVVYPQVYSEASGDVEPWIMQTECLLRGAADAEIDVYVRFLHLLLRSEVSDEQQAGGAQPMAVHWRPDTWEEGVEREVTALSLAPDRLVARPRSVEFAFPAARMVEQAAGQSTATIVREHQPLSGLIGLAAERIGTDLYKLCVRIENTTALAHTSERRDAIMLQSLISTHTILRASRGDFISLLDPPPDLRDAAGRCQNLHTWPVLVGNEGERDTLLSSPIILYDYPQIAPESPGALFDGTEIDELLSLRIMTLTDEEKEEMRRGDERAREILERTEALSPEQLMKLHGTVRSLRPFSEGDDE
jgi:hypothetical protein